MPKMCFRAFDGKVAIWEKPATGDPLAPFNDPANNLQYIRFHSDLNYLNNNLIQTNISVVHPSVAGVTGTGYSINNSGSASSGVSKPIMDGQALPQDVDLYTHGLGYVPLFFVLYDGEVVSGSIVVQTDTEDRIRMVSAYATPTKICLRTVGISSKNALASVTRSYDVYIFKNPAPDPTLPAFDVKLSGVGQRIVFGQGKIRNGQSTMRRIKTGDVVELAFPMSRATDVRNGGIRNIRHDGNMSDVGTYNGALFNFSFVPLSYG